MSGGRSRSIERGSPGQTGRRHSTSRKRAIRVTSDGGDAMMNPSDETRMEIGVSSRRNFSGTIETAPALTEQPPFSSSRPFEPQFTNLSKEGLGLTGPVFCTRMLPTDHFAGVNPIQKSGRSGRSRRSSSVGPRAHTPHSRLPPPAPQLRGHQGPRGTRFDCRSYRRNPKRQRLQSPDEQPNG